MGIQELRQIVGGARDRTCQTELGHIVGEDTVDQVKLGGGEGFLGLDDFHIVGNAGVKPLSRQVQCFLVT